MIGRVHSVQGIPNMALTPLAVLLAGFLIVDWVLHTQHCSTRVYFPVSGGDGIPEAAASAAAYLAGNERTVVPR